MAASKLSQSLGTGIYDTGTGLLRTCSLPNLGSLLPLPGASAERSDDVGGGSDNGVCDREGGGNTEFVEASDSDQSKDGERTNTKESSETEKAEKEEEEEWSSSEDEDLRQLVKTLKNFVEKASKSLVIYIYIYIYTYMHSVL